MLFLDFADLEGEVVVVLVFISELWNGIISKITLLMQHRRLLLHLQWQESIRILLLSHDLWLLKFSVDHAVVHFAVFDGGDVGDVDFGLVFGEGAAPTSLLS